MLQNVAQVHFDLDRVLGDIDHDVTEVLIDHLKHPSQKFNSIDAQDETENYLFCHTDPKSLGMCQISLSLLIFSFKTGRGNQNWF